jgi:hypothetical protein
VTRSGIVFVKRRMRTRLFGGDIEVVDTGPQGGCDNGISGLKKGSGTIDDGSRSIQRLIERHCVIEGRQPANDFVLAPVGSRKSRGITADCNRRNPAVQQLCYNEPACMSGSAKYCH